MALSANAVERFNRIFWLFDTNCDCFLTMEDFMSQVQTVAEQNNTSPDSDYLTKFEAMQTQTFQTLVSLADTDKDNRISIDEWGLS